MNPVPPFPSRGGTAPARTAGPRGTTGDPVSVRHGSEPEIVQLTLSREGIWHVPAAPESDTSFTRPAPRRIFALARLSPSVSPQYAPTGRLQASTSTPGLLLDIYV